MRFEDATLGFGGKTRTLQALFIQLKRKLGSSGINMYPEKLHHINYIKIGTF